MSERNEKRIFNVIFAVLAIVIIVFAVDIEIKLSELMNSEPMVVNAYPETTEGTTVDVYSFHNQLTADNTTTTLPLSTTIHTEPVTSEPTTVITSPSTQAYTQTTAEQSSDDFIISSGAVATVTESPATAVPSTIWSVDADQNFYRTESGTKYHKADCSYLKSSRILVTVDEIISEGYEPCSKCVKGE